MKSVALSPIILNMLASKYLKSYGNTDFVMYAMKRIIFTKTFNGLALDYSSTWLVLFVFWNLENYNVLKYAGHYLSYLWLLIESAFLIYPNKALSVVTSEFISIIILLKICF